METNSNANASTRTALAQQFFKLFPPSNSERFALGEIIFREGQPATRCYVICDGQVELSVSNKGHRAVVETVGPGELMGLSAAFSKSTYATTATAVTPTSAICISHDAVVQGLELFPEMRTMILKSLSNSVKRVLRSIAAIQSRKRRKRSSSKAAHQQVPAAVLH